MDPAVGNCRTTAKTVQSTQRDGTITRDAGNLALDRRLTAPHYSCLAARKRRCKNCFMFALQGAPSRLAARGVFLANDSPLRITAPLCRRLIMWRLTC